MRTIVVYLKPGDRVTPDHNIYWLVFYSRGLPYPGRVSEQIMEVFPIWKLGLFIIAYKPYNRMSSGAQVWSVSVHRIQLYYSLIIKGLSDFHNLT